MRMSRIRTSFVLTITSLVVALASCGGSGGGAAPSTTAPPASTTTTVASTTTTLYTPTGNAADDLKALSGALGGLDYSKVSSSSCGDFGMVVAPGGLRFFQWTAGLWVEQPAAVPSIAAGSPFMVTSRDYTRDSILDYLVRWDSSDPHGSILMINTTTCAWDWADLFTGSGTVKFVKGLQWSSANGRIEAKLPASGGGLFDAEMVYDAPYRTFVSTTEAGY